MGGVGARDRRDNSSREDTRSLAHELSGGVLAREEFVEVLEVVLGQDLFEHGHALAYVQHPVQPWLLPLSRQPEPAAAAREWVGRETSHAGRTSGQTRRTERPMLCAGERT